MTFVAEPAEVVRTSADPVEEHGRPPVACPNLSGHARDGVAGPIGAALLQGRGGDLLGAPVLESGVPCSLSRIVPFGD